MKYFVEVLDFTADFSLATRNNCARKSSKCIEENETNKIRFCKFDGKHFQKWIFDEYSAYSTCKKHIGIKKHLEKQEKITLYERLYERNESIKIIFMYILRCSL